MSGERRTKPSLLQPAEAADDTHESFVRGTIHARQEYGEVPHGVHEITVSKRSACSRRVIRGQRLQDLPRWPRSGLIISVFVVHARMD